MAERMVRILLYKSWRKRFMRETDPERGSKIAIQIKDVKQQNLDDVRRLLSGIDEKYIEYALIYFPSWAEWDREPRVFCFSWLDEFPEAARRFRAFMWSNHPEYIFPLWIGGVTLYVLVQVNGETLPALKILQQRAVIPKNYTGRRL